MPRQTSSPLSLSKNPKSLSEESGLWLQWALAGVPDCHSTSVAELTVQILWTSEQSQVYHIPILDVCKLVLLLSHKNPCSRTKYSAILWQETLLFWKHNCFSSNYLVDKRKTMLELLRMFPATWQKKKKNTLSLAILTCCAFVEEKYL